MDGYRIGHGYDIHRVSEDRPLLQIRRQEGEVSGAGPDGDDRAGNRAKDDNGGICDQDLIENWAWFRK